jgi:NADH-quinone oxidoreductase subunit D
MNEIERHYRYQGDPLHEGEVPSDIRTEELTLNMGPQHPSTHGVLRVLLQTDGELVLKATPYVGYLHRCAEKMAEQVTYRQFTLYTDRLDYLAAMNNNLGFALAAEKLGAIEVPARAQYLRVIFAELNRIASHLVATGCYGLDMGAFTPFVYCFREREYVLDLFEAACGARLTYSYITIGGVREDLPEGWIGRCREFLDYLEPKITEYNNLLSYNHIFINRTARVGVCPPDLALAYGLTGPCLRGSGVPWDLRKAMPYCRYDEFDFEVPVGRGEQGTVGDSWDRYFVRLLEMIQSVRIIRQALDKLADGPVQAKVPRLVKLPAGEIYYEVENPRGQLGFHLVSEGGTSPYRLKIRGPSFCNLSILPAVARNCLLADIAALLGSLDIVMGEVDR